MLRADDLCGAGQCFAEEIAASPGAGFYIGLPRPGGSRSHRLRSWLHDVWEMFDRLGSMPMPFVAALANPHSLTARSFSKPAALITVTGFNRPDVQAAKIPAVGGVAYVRTIEALSSAATAPRECPRGEVLRVDTSYPRGYI